MLVNLLEELTWGQFTTLDEYRNLPLQEQISHYKQYLSDLDQARQNLINYQNKGRKVPGQRNTPLACSAGMDVVFVIDYTASMGDEIEDVKSNVSSIVNTIITESGGNYRLGLVLFDEYEGNGTITYETNTLYTNLPASQRIIIGPTSNPNTSHGVIQVLTAYEMMSSNNQLSFGEQLGELNDSLPLGRGAGFVTTGEPGDLALEEVINSDFAGVFRSDVAKLIILLTDDEPGGYDGLANNPAIVTRLESLRDTCINENIQLITLSQLAILPNTSYRIISDNANGIYDNSLSPSVAIQAIQDICVENA